MFGRNGKKKNINCKEGYLFERVLHRLKLIFYSSLWQFRQDVHDAQISQPIEKKKKRDERLWKAQTFILFEI